MTDLDSNHSVSQSNSIFYLEQAAAPKGVFTLLGPLLVRSQCDDFFAVAGVLVGNISTRGIKYTFVRQKAQIMIILMKKKNKNIKSNIVKSPQSSHWSKGGVSHAYKYFSNRTLKIMQ